MVGRMGWGERMHEEETKRSRKLKRVHCEVRIPPDARRKKANK